MKKKTERYEWTGKTYLIDSKDKRYKKFLKIKEKTGISPDETWNLYINIAEFIFPRLKMFKEHTIGTPGCLNSFEEWHEILDKMIWSFEQIAKDEEPFDAEENKKYYKKIDEGLKLFYKYFQCLWW